MMLAIARTALCLLATVSALAQSVSATVDISMSGFTVYSSGYAEYFCTDREAGCWSGAKWITGSHYIANGTAGTEAARKDFGGPSVMRYDGTVSGPTASGDCYRAEISGEGNLGGSQRATSAQICAAPLERPPGPHAIDICPLLIDIDGDGILTSGSDQPVAFFDPDGDGVRQPSGWTAPGADDAFPWLDLNGNKAPIPASFSARACRCRPASSRGTGSRRSAFSTIQHTAALATGS
jgi:hypothetical protein